eukprot:NODE_7750_length_745_cov_34.397106_g7136_i0.p1 GENE.NODE_7750_length_745_cov_34.397106_g7136_i0~~NODE_7750_length_745_cov_34.397106_g7136_i0.p1  ORF type:complete len:162 (-),score=43.05 NODE_7750_length_745_cov_34.397106_g7136_i0:210-695(-)
MPYGLFKSSPPDPVKGPKKNWAQPPGQGHAMFAAGVSELKAGTLGGLDVPKKQKFKPVGAQTLNRSYHHQGVITALDVPRAQYVQAREYEVGAPREWVEYREYVQPQAYAQPTYPSVTAANYAPEQQYYTAPQYATAEAGAYNSYPSNVGYSTQPQGYPAY